MISCRNQFGFGLIQVLLASSFIMTTGLIFSKYIITQQQQQKYSEIKVDIEQIVSVTRGTFNNELVCSPNVAFMNPNTFLNLDILPSEIQLEKLRIFEEDFLVSNQNFSLLSRSLIDLKVNNLKVLSVDFSLGVFSLQGDLVLSFNKPKASVGNNEMSLMPQKLSMTLKGIIVSSQPRFKIIGCFVDSLPVDSSAQIEQMKKSACINARGTYDESAGLCTFNFGTCTNAEYVSGFNMDGSVICQQRPVRIVSSPPGSNNGPGGNGPGGSGPGGSGPGGSGPGGSGPGGSGPGGSGPGGSGPGGSGPGGSGPGGSGPGGSGPGSTPSICNWTHVAPGNCTMVSPDVQCKGDPRQFFVSCEDAPAFGAVIVTCGGPC